jgi:hypothetical protein
MKANQDDRISIEIRGYDLFGSAIQLVVRSTFCDAFDRLLEDLNAFRDWDDSITDFTDAVWAALHKNTDAPERWRHITPDWIIKNILGQRKDFDMLRLEFVRASRDRKIDTIGGE